MSKRKKRSFQKLDEDSTSNRKACETFWTSSTEEWSRNSCSARTSAWRELQQETWSKSLKDLVKVFPKRKNWLKRRNRWVRIITLLKVKKEDSKLDTSIKHLVASDPDIAKADVTRSKVELGKYKDVLAVSDPKAIKMEKQLSTYNRTYLRLLLRLRYKIDEAHRKLATYLCRNVRLVLLPKFETSRMVRNADRSISAVTARKMMNWEHYRFRKMLLYKAALSSSCQVNTCDEHYTSKTCGSCGELHHNLEKIKTSSAFIVTMRQIETLTQRGTSSSVI